MRAVVIHAPSLRRPATQAVIDQVADGRTVAPSGKAMRQAPILERHRRRTVASLDVVKNLDGCLYPAPEPHSVHQAGKMGGEYQPVDHEDKEGDHENRTPMAQIVGGDMHPDMRQFGNDESPCQHDQHQ